MQLVTLLISVLCARVCVCDGVERDLAPNAMTGAEYTRLRACASSASTNGGDVASCFPLLHEDEKLKVFGELGQPSIVIVPDCNESAHLVCHSSTAKGNEECSAHFAGCHNRFPPSSANYSVRLLGPHVGHSAYAVEAALPSRLEVAGPYAALIRALLDVGYTDKQTLRAVAWDMQSMGIFPEVLRSMVKKDSVIVARGAGCALAVGAGVNVRAVLCLAAGADGIPDATLHAHELGLHVRRRGRPLPVVRGPWGDGALAGAEGVRCNVAAPVHVQPGSDAVLCAGDCKRWVTGARQVDCGALGGSLVAQVQCMARALLTSARSS